MSSLPSAELIVNRYLYNADVTPVDLTAASLIRAMGAQGASYRVNTNEYMTQGAGRFVKPAYFAMVRNFLDGDYDKKLKNSKEFTVDDLGVMS